MEDYKPNSHLSKKSINNAPVAIKKDKDIKPIVKAKTKKKNKFAETFISEDAVNIKSYILMDVLVPAIKKAVSDIVTDGISMLLYGDTSHSAKRSSSSAPYVSYNRYSDRDRRDEYRYIRSGYSYDDVLLPTRGDAEEVLDAMGALIETYGVVSVADMYDLVGVTCNYTDNKYGWTNIRNAEPVRVRDGYILKLPKPGPID